MSAEMQIVIVIFLIILVIGLLYYVNYDEIKRSKYKWRWQHSVGTMDGNAAHVLEQINTIRRPTIEDNYIAGNIIAYNMLDGRIRNNPEVGMNAIARYETALRQARELPIDRDRGLPLDFIIDDIANFTVINLEDLLQDDADTVEMYVNELINILNDIPAVRQHTIENKVSETMREAKNAKEYSAKYLDKSIQHTSKTQNVHDSAVVKDLNLSLNIIRESASPRDWQEVLCEVRDYSRGLAENGEISEKKCEAIARVLDHIAENTLISSYGVTEGNILKYVWDRADHPKNRQNRTKIREAIIDEIANSVEDGEVMCPGGRSARLLGSLVTLDFDPNVGAACTFEDYKNEIFERCRKLIDAKIESAKKSNNPELRKVAMSYEDPTMEIPDDLSAAFKDNIKEGIDAIIAEYSGKMRAQQAEELKRDCYAAII